MDRITKEQRSYTMSKIRGKNTKPERVIFKLLKSRGLSFKKHYKLLGNPDVVFPKARIAVFIDGDFWHGRDYEKRKDSLPDYWVKKIGRNIVRDKRNRARLRKEGWIVIRFWEHRILKRPKGCINRIVKQLQASQETM